MKILFDFLTLHSKNGAAEYTRRVFYALLAVIRNREETNVSIYCLYDCKAMPAYSELQPNLQTSEKVYFIDIQNGVSYINSQGFDVFFLGCAQNGGWHPELSQLNCRTIIVFHDCVWEELYNNDIGIYQTLYSEKIFNYREGKPKGKSVYFDVKGPTLRFCRWLLHSRANGVLERGAKMLPPSLEMLATREDNVIVTVSHYSRSSIMYNFGIDCSRISVKYSPERLYASSEDSSIENPQLLSLLKSKRKYYLIVSANRAMKNAKKALSAFKRYSTFVQDVYVLTIGFGEVCFPNHIDLLFLSDSDLYKAYKNCYALIYPSLFEGFGYPPLEAMKYGKPVLSSNVCSMPEILGDAPIYFSPFYESAIFNALLTLKDSNYSNYSNKSYKRYCEVHEIQERDLRDLVNMILGLK